MRALLDYRSALRGRSGVGEYVHQLASALLGRDAASGNPGDPLEVVLFSSSWKDRLRVSDSLARAITIDRRVPVSILNLAWHRLEWPPVEALAGISADVVHSLHPLLMPARRAAQIITVHDLNFLSRPELTRAEIRRDYPPLVRDHANRADHVIVPSRYTAGEVQRLLGVPIERISVCSPGTPDWTRERPYSNDGYILYLGTLEPRKNVGTLLDAYERLLAGANGARPVPDLVLAGGATPEAAPWLERIGRPPLAGHVKAIGYVNPTDRQRVYEGARLLVQPSVDEGFGIPVLEAMSLGLPVVAANRGALPEVLGDAGLLVSAEDADGMAAGLRRVIDNQALAASFRERGIERAKAFRWATAAEGAVNAYRQAIEHRAARRRMHS